MPFSQTNTTVIPAKAGIHLPAAAAAEGWIPAFAGMTACLNRKY
jgi:hypothetical protein